MKEEITNGSATPNFLKLAVDEMTTYKTPKSIIDYVNMSLIIINPPYNGKRKKRVFRANKNAAKNSPQI